MTKRGDRYSLNSPSRGEARLPKNRFRAYFDVLKHRFGTLLLLSMLTFPFFVPLLFNETAWSVYLAGAETGVEGSDLLYLRFVTMASCSAISIPLWTFAGLGLAGAIEVIGRLAHQEGSIYLLKDFGKGIRENLPSGLLGGTYIGIGNFLFALNVHFYPTLGEMPGWASILIFIAFLLVDSLFWIQGLYLLSSSCSYRFRFGASNKNCLLLTLVLYPKNLLMLLVSGAPLILFYLLPDFYVRLGVDLILLLGGISHLLLAWTMHSFSVFDRYINARYAPSEEGRGLDRPETTDEGPERKESRHG